MGLRINQNIAAMNAYRNLSVNDGMMAKSLEKLSSTTMSSLNSRPLRQASMFSSSFFVRSRTLGGWRLLDIVPDLKFALPRVLGGG